jgi:hypothetical protein
MKGKATDGVDGRLTKDDGLDRGDRHEEEPVVFPGSRGHPPPWRLIGSSEFGADRGILIPQEQEDGIGSVIGVKAAAMDERVDGGGRKATVMKEVMSDAAKLARIRRGEFQAGLGQEGLGLE